MMTRSPGLTAVASGVLVLLVAAAVSTGRGQQPDRIALSFDREAGTLSLRAEEVLLSDILRALEEREGVRVVVPELSDRRLSVEASDEPLGELFTRLLSEGARFWFVDTRGESVLSPRQGDKPGRQAPQRREGLPRKSAEPQPETTPRAEGARVKPTPERALWVSRREGVGQKDPPRPHGSVRRYSDKTAAQATPFEERHFRLRLRFTREQVTLEQVIEVPGPYRSPGRLMGSQLWALEGADGVLAVGSFRDPFEVHSLFPDDRPHAIQQAESAQVDISIDEEAFAAQALSEVRLEFYELTDAPPTQQLNVETFDDLREVSERRALEISGEAIEGAFRRQNLLPREIRR